MAGGKPRTPPRNPRLNGATADREAARQAIEPAPAPTSPPPRFCASSASPAWRRKNDKDFLTQKIKNDDRRSHFLVGTEKSRIELELGNKILGIDFYTLAIIAIIAWIVLLYFVVTGRGSSSAWSRRQLYRKSFDVEKNSSPNVRISSLDVRNFPFDITDIGHQMHAVMAASFQKRRLLNPGEYRAFKIIETDIAASRRGYRVFAQTSLGRF